MNKKYVIITTDKDKKGIFSGYLIEDKSPDWVILEQGRMIIFFSAETHGVVGLAAYGPAKGSRVSYAAPRIKLYGITSIIECSKEAIKKFGNEIWN